MNETLCSEENVETNKNLNSNNEDLNSINNLDKLSNMNISHSVVGQYLDDNFEEFSHNKKYKCAKCKDSTFESNEELRKHYKTPWHEHNVKVFSDSKESLSFEEYTDFTFMNKN